MKRPYDEIINMLKLRYNFIANSDSPSNLNNDDMTWATQMRNILDVMKNNNITVEDGINYLDNAIQENANNYKNKIQKDNS
ncbi:hypothetical protein ABFV69_13540 [Staphylococcus saprophyticus]